MKLLVDNLMQGSPHTKAFAIKFQVYTLKVRGIVSFYGFLFSYKK